MHPAPKTAAFRSILRRVMFSGLVVLSLLPLAGRAAAGGGPENVLLVVNANSAGSKRVANHYCRMRDLPASNVLYLDYEGPPERVSVESYRERILRPILQAIGERRLALQVDMIAYSTDFPWLVNLTKDYPTELKLPKPMAPIASITGATYFYQHVLAKDPGLLQLDANWYVLPAAGKSRLVNAGRCYKLDRTRSRAFRARYTWREDGQRTSDPKVGRRYMMSTMLGVTTGRGNTVDEVIASLDRAIAAEASPPQGTFYYVRNNTPRSTPRHGCYAASVAELKRLGAQAKVVSGTLPNGAKDVLGLMTGDRELNFDRARLRIQPGAICEHLTSYGGVLTKGAYQTPLSEVIRAGATGASGTVREPFANQGKFPLPSLHVHYRRGCSLAESFYQSVSSPYQLLIVGDPLCQPWAKRPGLAIEGWPNAPGESSSATDLSTLGFAELGISTKAKSSKDPTNPTASNAPSETSNQEETTAVEEGPPPVMQITPQVTASTGRAGGVWELFVDGRLRMRLPSGKTASFRAKDLGPGWHDLRCVGMESDPIEGQGRQIGSIVIDEIDSEPVAEVTAQVDSPSVSLSGKVAVSASAEGAERIVILQHSREVAVIEGDSGGALIPAELLGAGRVRLQAVAQPSGAASPYVWAQIR